MGAIELKRVIAVLSLLLLLAACGNGYHEEIRESFAKDTEEIKDLTIEVIEDEREFTDEEQEKIDSYVRKYDENLDSSDEAHAYLLTRNLIENQSSSLLPSEIENIIDNADNIRVTLEGGFEAYKEANKEED